jgi:hypothetical protein
VQFSGGKIPLNVIICLPANGRNLKAGELRSRIQYLEQVAAAVPRITKAFNESGTCLTHMGRSIDALWNFR